MILSDGQIVDEVVDGDTQITPFNGENLQPASYDITLGNEFYRFTWSEEPFNPLEDDPSEITFNEVLDDGETFVLEPNEFALASTEERVSLPDDLLANVEGRSSWGRSGLAIHITAGVIDPNFGGQITLELKNNNHVPLELTVGSRIGQLVFKEMSEEADVPYGEELGSHYQGQSGPQLPRLHE